MKLISWNTNGLRATLKNGDLDWIKNENIDFLAIQETKLQDEQIPKEIYNLGFKNISTNCARKAGYSGVLSMCNFDCVTHKSLFFDDTEGRVLEHSFNDIIIFNIYFPNGQKNDERLEYKMNFYNNFLAYLEKLLQENKKIIICGDVNTAHKEIDLKNPKTNSKTSGFLPIEREWIDKLLSHGFIDTFRAINGDIKDAYSWWSYRFNARIKNVGWRIDYFFISKNLKDNLKNAYILSHIQGSDHCPIGIDIDI